jgi:hypothetical protein
MAYGQGIFDILQTGIPSLGLDQQANAQQVGVTDLRQQLIDMLLNPQEPQQAPEIRPVQRTLGSIGDALGAYAAAMRGNPALNPQIIRRLEERRAQQQGRLDQQSQRERQANVQALGLQLGAEQEGLARTEKSKERAQAAETRQGDIAREERRFDEVERGSLEKEARGMGVFKPNMTDDELGAAISGEAKRRADAALGADSASSFEQGRMVGEDILNGFLFGDPEVGPSISDRLASGQTPEQIMFEFSRRLAPLTIDPVRRIGLEAILERELQKFAKAPKRKLSAGVRAGRGGPGSLGVGDIVANAPTFQGAAAKGIGAFSQTELARILGNLFAGPRSER